MYLQFKNQPVNNETKPIVTFIIVVKQDNLEKVIKTIQNQM